MAASSMTCMMQTVLCLIVILGCFYTSFGHDHGHGHSHDDVEKPAHFKYSQEANADAKIHHNHGEADSSAGHGHTHGDGHTHNHAPSQGPTPKGPHKSEETKPKSNPWRKPSDTMWLWLNALGSTAIVSAAPVFILLLIPLENTAEYRPMLKVLLSFASGGLLGDAFLHLIPHALSPHTHGEEDGGHSHDHGHSHGHGEHDHSHDMGVGLWVLAGLIAFLVVEKFVRYVKGGHGHSHGGSEKKTEEKKNGKSGDSGTQKKSKGDNTPDKKKNTKKVAKKEVEGETL